MITVAPITDPSALAALLKRIPMQPFLQSWAWGDFQHAYGRRIWRLGAYDDNQLVGAITLIEHQLILGQSYLYAPRGPVALTMAAAQALFQATRDIGQQARAMYVKIDPSLYDFPFDPAAISDFEPGTTLQEPNTLVLDLQPSAEQLLAAMHPKTRYNIRLAEKHQVQTRWSVEDGDYAQYLALQKETAVRQGIRLHPDQYFQLMFNALRQAGMCELAIAELEGQPLAINLIIWHHQTAVFNHGGSTQSRKEVMAPYLLQWASILRAKEKGMRVYDFRGIAPDNEPDHKLAGVTRFKLGFGGRRVVYPSAQNAILNRPWWLAYRTAKKLRGGG